MVFKPLRNEKSLKTNLGKSNKSRHVYELTFSENTKRHTTFRFMSSKVKGAYEMQDLLKQIIR